jgi:hypothetical protein
MPSKVDHSLAHEFDEIIGDYEKETEWLEAHSKEVIKIGIDDPMFCSSSLVFVPSKNMGFSMYRTTNCTAGEYIGFLYPNHIERMKDLYKDLSAQMDKWESDDEE